MKYLQKLLLSIIRIEMISLTKVLGKGSLRWIGQNYSSLFPVKTVIAGKDIKDISDGINLKPYKFQRFNIKNIFIAHDSLSIFYVYVNPRYRNYRLAFRKIIGDIPVDFHVDHILSRNLALHFQYNYVLLCMVPGQVNSKHGQFEKIKFSTNDAMPNICYSDDRIFHKILSRPPLARQRMEELKKDYNPMATPSFGLTLKQKGIWNSAFGFDLVDMKLLINTTSEIDEIKLNCL